MCWIHFNSSLLFLFLVIVISPISAQLREDGSDDDDDDDVETQQQTQGAKPNPVPEFRVYENNNIEEGLPCVLVRMEATITIEPKRQINKKTSVELPMAANSKGNCGRGSDSRISLSWSSFHFNWHFQKSRVSDAWYVDVIELSYNTSDKLLQDGAMQQSNSIVSIRTDDPLTLFLTPIGRSYSCVYPADIKIQDSKRLTRVSIQLRNVRIQPFASMTQRQFGDAFHCPSEAGRKDDTVPFAVGMTLAFVVLCTVGSYAGYRYVKVKKIEYDTME